jgi:hypothetical protein
VGIVGYRSQANQARAAAEGALALLEPWVEYCIEQTGGLPGRLAQLSLAMAGDGRRAVRSPEAVGGDLGNRLNRPMREIDPQILDLTGG